MQMQRPPPSPPPQPSVSKILVRNLKKKLSSTFLFGSVYSVLECWNIDFVLSLDMVALEFSLTT